MASMRLATPLVRPRAVKAPRLARSAHDLVIQHAPNSAHTPTPIIKFGPPTGGRSASSGHTVTVFGCTGFLGRYLVHKLGKAGAQVVVPYRDEDEKRHLRVMGDLGQIVPLEWDARNVGQIRECISHSDTVYNLVGRDWETRNFSYEDVNVKTAGLIAKTCAEHNTPRLIHMSHLNASPDSPSAFYRSKYHGERAVRDAFPEATIVRPAAMFGAEDWLLNQLARYPILYKLNSGLTRTMPVHVMDVAAALKTMLDAPLTSTASTFALPGPEIYTYNDLIKLLSILTLKPVSSAPTIPRPVMQLIATVLNKAIWWPTVVPDEVVRKYIDDAGVEALLQMGAEEKPSGWGAQDGASQGMTGVDGEPVKGWTELQMEPETLEEHAIKYLRRYRSASTYDMPVEMANMKPPKPYHVVP